MIFSDTPFKMELQFICLCLIYSFQAPVFNAIPFLYYRTNLSCNIDGVWQSCTEQQICDNNYEFQFVDKQGMESISMDYGLVCEKRLVEASIMSLGFVGEVAAFLIAVLTEIPKSKKTNILFILMFVEGFLLFSVSFIKGSLTYIMFVIFVWNFVYSYIYSQIFAYANDMYTTAIKDKAVNMINIAWTGGALMFILFAQMDGNWIDHVAYFSGATVLTLSVFFYLLRSPPAEIDPIQAPFKQATSAPKDEAVEAKEQQKNFVDDLIQKFKVMKSNKKYMKNAIIYILTWSTFQLSYSTPFIAFNTLGGNIQNNVMLSILFDFGGSFITFYLLTHFDPLRLLLNNILIIGVIQTLAFFVPVTSFAFQLIPILATKLSTRCAFPTLLTLLPFILPYQFNQLVFNIANVVSILLSTLLPFYRYYMESNGINIFCGIGAITLLLLFVATGFKTLEDENADIKAARLSRDFKKRSSFAPMKRNSDVIIETMLRKSSFLTQQAAKMVLDKQSVAEERKYMIQQKQTELETIQEI
ncbi:hypothetical protein ABPG74_021906 [Tetrahymena malaccensis]